MSELDDKCLWAETEQDLIEALPEFHDGEEWITGSVDYALDIIGTLENQPAVYDEDELVTPATYYDGFHANIRCIPEITATLPKSVIIQVNNPKRGFA